MSGTSLDGVDGVLIHFDDEQSLKVIARNSLGFPSELRQLLFKLAQSESLTFTELATAESELTRCYARCWKQLEMKTGDFKPQAIGCHGQTLEHRPESGFSFQLLNPSLLSELTGCDIVCDFRRRDLAAAGQGAPLVPAFHRSFFASPNENRVIINLGGIANLTWLPANEMEQAIGFDTGPANLLLDAWCFRHLNQEFDKDGRWSAQGVVIEKLLKQLLSDPYFSAPHPKSTGREHFNLSWLDKHLELACCTEHTPIDIQSTLAELTAQSLADAICKLDPRASAKLLICGGGSQNQDIMKRVEGRLTPRSLVTTADAGLPPQDVEAAAFAWLAKAHLEGRPGNMSSVTGAKGERVLGGFYPA